MTAVRMLGLIVLVFVVSLPASYLMHADTSGWHLPTNDNDTEQEKEERDDVVVDVLCIKAMKEMSDGNHTKAIATYTKAIERDPKYSFAYIGRGDAFALRGDLDRAVQDYNQALRLDPSNSAARERLAIARMEQAEK
jgi:tetratricopeptide (TPR) repeat protein